MFDRIFILDKGSCFFSGTVDEAVRGKRFAELFGRGVEVVQRNGRFHSYVL